MSKTDQLEKTMLDRLARQAAHRLPLDRVDFCQIFGLGPGWEYDHLLSDDRIAKPRGSIALGQALADPVCATILIPPEAGLPLSLITSLCRRSATEKTIIVGLSEA